MKIKTLTGAHCIYCQKIPVVSEYEKNLIEEGKSINKVMSLESNKQDVKPSSDSMQQVNDLLNGFLSMFDDGSDDDNNKDETISAVTDSDLKNEEFFYIHDDCVYMQFKYNTYRVTYCPFCGSVLNI